MSQFSCGIYYSFKFRIFNPFPITLVSNLALKGFNFENHIFIIKSSNYIFLIKPILLKPKMRYVTMFVNHCFQLTGKSSNLFWSPGIPSSRRCFHKSLNHGYRVSKGLKIIYTTRNIIEIAYINSQAGVRKK